MFIQPPSLEVLEQRLRSRSTETEESLQKRLQIAKVEMEYGISNENLFISCLFCSNIDICIGRDPANFDIVIVNDQLEKSYHELKQFLLPVINQIKQ